MSNESTEYSICFEVLAEFEITVEAESEEEAAEIFEANIKHSDGSINWKNMSEGFIQEIETAKIKDIY
tara:strand:- start:4655 stop:4858 length:204 start_codon:yes stop_codon:yes gene_type:complete